MATLQMILVKVDRAAMAVSLETRMPFDPEVIDLAMAYRNGCEDKNGHGKWSSENCFL